MALNVQRGKLYAATPSGELWSYDVKGVLDGKTKSGSDLPAKEIGPLAVAAGGWHLSADGRYLYSLDRKNPRRVQLIRVDTATERIDRKLALVDHTKLLCSSGDGKTLFAISSAPSDQPSARGTTEAVVQTIDSATVELQGTAWLPLAVDQFSLRPNGQALCSGRGPNQPGWSFRGVFTADLDRAWVRQWWGGFPQGSRPEPMQFCFSRDGSRVYLCYLSANRSSNLSAWKLHEEPAGHELLGYVRPQRRNPGAAPEHLPALPLQLTPDGNFLITPEGDFYPVSAFQSGGKQPAEPKAKPQVGLKSGWSVALFPEAGRVDPFFAAAADPQRKALFILAEDRALKHYSYPDFKLQGTYRLPATGYRCTYDTRRGLLYVATTKQEPPPPNRTDDCHPLRSLNQPGVTGDLHVYDVNEVGRTEPKSELKPAAVIRTEACISRLFLSPDAASLYYLDVRNREKSKLGRIDTVRRQKNGEVLLAPDTSCACATADGKTIYAGSGFPALQPNPPPKEVNSRRGRLQVIDTASMRLTETVLIERAPDDLAATDDRRVYLSTDVSSGTLTDDLLVVDMRDSRAIVGRWRQWGCHSQIQLSPDQTKLFRTSFVGQPDVQAYLLSGVRDGVPKAVGGRRLGSVRPELAYSYLTPDADGDALTYSASGLPAGLSLDPNTGLVSGTIGVAAHGSSPYSMTVIASDGTNSRSQSFLWTVSPQVVIIPPGPQSNADGDTVSLPISATDHSGASLTYSAIGLPTGLTIDPNSGLVTGTIANNADTASPYPVTVTATDGTYQSTVTFAWTFSHVFLQTPMDQTNNDGDVVSLQLTARDNDGDSLTYSATGLPTGLSISPTTGLISGTIDNAADANSPYAVTVMASDGIQSNSTTFNWTVNQVITIDDPGAQVNAIGDVVSLPISVTDALGNSLTYSATGLPSGLSIDSATGNISGTIALGADTASPYSVTVSVSDGVVTASEAFAWTVNHVSLTNPGPQDNAEGDVVSLQLAGRDADGDSLIYSATGLPPALSIDPTTGIISGTLPANEASSGIYQVTVAASDGTNAASQTFDWTITHVALANPGDQTNTEGDTVSLQLQGHDADGDVVTYSAGSLPPGLSLNSASGLISGTISAGDAANGPYSVTVASRDGTNATSQSFTWTVNPQVALTTIPDQSNNEGDTVFLQVQASDSDSNPLTYSASGLPTGLSIDSAAGLISGTIADGASDDAPYAVLVSASNATYSTSQVFTWGVTHGNNQAPVMINPGAQETSVGEEVALQIQASDPDGDPVTYTAIGLPPDLSIDPFSGKIMGAITDDDLASSPYPVTVSADDGSGAAVTQTFSWMVAEAPIILQPQAITATDGIDTGDITVATFTTTDPSADPTNYNATVDWGDGTSSSGAILYSNGTFEVVSDHQYDTPGTFPVNVSIADAYTNRWTAIGTATVANAPLAGTGFNLGALIGQAETFSLASFTDGNPNVTSQAFTASIDWGDGSTATLGTIANPQLGVFGVSATHAYSSTGSYTATVTVTDRNGTIATATTTVTVGNIFAGNEATLTIATLTDANVSAPISDYTGTINWGDGTPSTSGVISGANGLYTIQGQHTYATAGAYTVTATVQDDGGSTITASQQAIVVRPSLHAVGNNLLAVPGTAISNQVIATFAVPNSTDSPSAFAALVDWGDGSPVDANATVLGSNGLFDVIGSHTYTEEGEYAVKVILVNSNLQAIGLAIAQAQVAPAMKPTILGPTAIPGGSVYAYRVMFGPVDMKDVNPGTWSVNDKANANVGQPTPIFSPDGMKVIGIQVLVGFNDVPAVIQLSGTGIKVNNQELKLAPIPIYVVQIQIKSSSLVPDSGFKQNDGAGTARIISGIKNPAMTTTAVVSVKGPIVNGNMVGVGFIDMGFIQSIHIVAKHALYAGFSPTLERASNVERRVFLDAGPGGILPWYDTTGFSLLDPLQSRGFLHPGAIAKPLENEKFIVGDSPSVLATDKFSLTEDGITKPATYFGIIYNFDIYFAARTTQEFFGSSGYYPTLGVAHWRFDASGKVNNAGVWSLARGAGASLNQAKGLLLPPPTPGKGVQPVTGGTFGSFLQKGERWLTLLTSE